MPLIEGTAGTVKVGPSGTPVTVNFIGEWEAEAEVEIKEQGPFIGNSAKSKIRAGKSCSGSMSGFVPVDQDAGQQDIIDAFNADTDVRLEFTATDGYVLTIAAAIIAKVKIGQKADEGVPISFDFEDNGGFTLAAAA
jgi:hypothetical protein